MSEPSREELASIIRELRARKLPSGLSDSIFERAADAIERLAAKPERERVIAQAICCPSGCKYIGDSEDGDTCYCDTADYKSSGIERQAQAVIRALKGTPSSTVAHIPNVVVTKQEW